MTTRILRAAAAALLLLTLGATAVLAGGWATIVPTTRHRPCHARARTSSTALRSSSTV